MSFGPESKERRGNKAPVPANPSAILNREQSASLRNVENYGWQLAFIRRPLFEQSVAVVTSPDRRHCAVLEPDGQVNMAPEISLRN